jgi:hypothetical protein
MNKKHYSLLLITVFIIVICYNSFASGKPETLSIIEENTTNDLDQIIFSINKLDIGNHSLEIYLEPYDVNILRQIDSPIKFDFDVEILEKRKNKTKRKHISIMLEKARIGVGISLFNVPGDFFWNSKADIKITISNFKYDDIFIQYYKKMRIWIQRNALFFE